MTFSSPVTGSQDIEALLRAARAEAVAAFVRSLQPSKLDDPADGSLILVDESAAWVRSDQTDGGGDWYLLDGQDNGGPVMLGEVLGYDETPEDRRPKSYEVCYTADDLDRMAKRFTASMQ